MQQWTTAGIMPPQTGRLALITGANSGIGYHIALQLARSGASVLLACRDLIKAEAARRRILAEVPAAHLEVVLLDLSSLDSIRAAAASLLANHRHLDLLINNAGVMALPQRRLTRDGFELQLGTNHLGHFALTGLLLPSLFTPPLAVPPRVVTVSSIAHRGATMEFDNLNWEHGYRPWPAYRRSKLANLLFGFELQRRLTRAGLPAISAVAHPGVANTNLFAAGPGQGQGVLAKMIPLILPLIAHSDAQGALPVLYAATAPGVQGGRFYGPDGFRQMRGYPIEVRAEAQASDETLAAHLWQASEQLTGIRFPIPE